MPNPETHIQPIMGTDSENVDPRDDHVQRKNNILFINLRPFIEKKFYCKN